MRAPSPRHLPPEGYPLQSPVLLLIADYPYTTVFAGYHSNELSRFVNLSLLWLRFLGSFLGCWDWESYIGGILNAVPSSSPSVRMHRCATRNLVDQAPVGPYSTVTLLRHGHDYNTLCSRSQVYHKVKDRKSVV